MTLLNLSGAAKPCHERMLELRKLASQTKFEHLRSMAVFVTPAQRNAEPMTSTGLAVGFGRCAIDGAVNGAASGAACATNVWQSSLPASVVSDHLETTMFIAKWFPLPAKINVVEGAVPLAAQSDFWRYEWKSDGHEYWAENFVCESTISLEEAFNLFLDHYADCMAGDSRGAREGGPDGPLAVRVSEGIRYRLPWNNYVDVIQVDTGAESRPGFKVQTVPGKHLLSGTVKNGLEMRGRELWMYQYGEGKDNFGQRWLNAMIAGGMWKVMATNFAKRIADVEKGRQQYYEKFMQEHLPSSDPFRGTFD